MPNLAEMKMNGIVGLFHYENMPMQYTEIFKIVKNKNFQ